MAVHLFNHQIAKTIASALLEIKAIILNPEKPFTWASGWRSPIYCDNRLSLSFPKVRTLVRDQLTELVKSKYPDAEAIAGVATAGIPQGALIADQLNLPYLYVRSSSKTHGLENTIEGLRTPGQKIVLIEDLISTGGSSLQAAEAIRNADMEVMGMAAIFTYGFPVSEENFKKHQVELWHLSDYSTLIDLALEKGYITSHLLETLHAWRSNPATWTP